jgi:hypothetical protein
MKKQPLIILGVILVLVILALTFYAYQKTQITTPIPQTPLTQSVKEQEDSSKSLEDKKMKEELEKLKQGFANDTLEEVEGIEENCTEEELVERKEYDEEIKKGLVKLAGGQVLEKGNSYLKVDFSQSSLKWTSTVKIDQNTSIEVANFESQSLTQASISDIQVGDDLTVRTTGENNILNSEFVASKIIIKK